jgi:hypothetical protein
MFATRFNNVVNNKRVNNKRSLAEALSEDKRPTP